MKQYKIYFLDFLILLLSIMLLFSGTACGKKTQPGQTADRYHCPMHPNYTSDKPGTCPICGMNLTPIPKSGKTTTKKVIKYRSTMNPTEISDKPGKDSMGMDMVPFEVEEKTGTNPESPQPVKTTTRKIIKYRSTMNPTEISDKPGKDSMGMDMVPFEVGEETGTGPKGLAAVTIAPEVGQRLGLTYGVVETKPFVKEIRTSARIAADETRQIRVTSRIEGWVEKLFVNVTGQPVKKGTPLLSIYSPELVTAQQELLTALTMVQEFKGNDFENLSRQGQNILNAARQRLKFWEISDKQIEQIEKSGQVQKSLTLYATASGFVSEKTVLPGQKIMAGESLMVITDLAHVWGLADIYEADVPYVKFGMPLEITLRSQPGKTYSGKILFLEPGLEEASRTLKARIDIVNKDLNLKPGMYADARLKIDLGKKLTIPESAVMRSGERDYAFAVGKEGQLQPVEIKLGARGDDFFEIISGLHEGDKVVTSANFLIDSESSLKAALEAVTGQPAQNVPTTETGGERHDKTNH